VNQGRYLLACASPRHQPRPILHVSWLIPNGILARARQGVSTNVATIRTSTIPNTNILVTHG